MQETIQVKHETWSSGYKFILATIGAAIGLANIWRFPYVVGTSGGSTFVFTYIVVSLLFVMPIIIAELMIGRYSKRSMISSMRKTAIDHDASPKWSLVGYLGILAMTLIQFFYFVIAGWVLYYFVLSVTVGFNDIDAQSSSGMFDALKGNPYALVICQTSLIVITGFIIAKGVRKGVEKSVSWLMPVLFISLLMFVFYGIYLGTIKEAVRFLFSFDYKKLNFEVIQLAMGQAFFSIGAGAGFIMTYGAYLKKDVSITKSALIIITADVGAALIAGLAVYSVVFAFKLSADAGPGLIFVALPVAFGQMQFGSIFGVVFFGALLAAVIPTLISGYEQVVCWLIELNIGNRAKMSALYGLFIWLGGLPAVLSFNYWSGIHIFDFIPILQGKNIFELYEIVAVVFLLPVCGFAIAIFSGWLIPDKSCQSELGAMNSTLYVLWKFLLKFVAPLCLLLIFITNIIHML